MSIEFNEDSIRGMLAQMVTHGLSSGSFSGGNGENGTIAMMCNNFEPALHEILRLRKELFELQQTQAHQLLDVGKAMVEMEKTKANIDKLKTAYKLHISLSGKMEVQEALRTKKAETMVENLLEAGEWLLDNHMQTLRPYWYNKWWKLKTKWEAYSKPKKEKK